MMLEPVCPSLMLTKLWSASVALVVDVLVSFAQSDLDAVGAYGGGVRADVI